MKRMTYQKLLLLGVAVITVVSLNAGNTYADEEIFIKGYTGPFSPFLQQGQWTTRQMEISNQGNKDRLCDLGCETTIPGKGTTRFFRQALIPAHSKLTVKFAYQPGEMTVLKNTKKDSGTSSCEQSYKLWEVETGRQLDIKSGNLLNISTDFKILGFLNTSRIDHDTNTFLKDDTSLLGKLKLVSGGNENSLPERWYGYSMLNMIVMGNIDFNNLTESQVNALLFWVKRGGTLLLTGHEEMSKTLQTRLGQHAGVKCLGVHWVDQLKTEELEKGKKADVTLEWPMPFAELYPTDAKVLFEANGLPLLTTKQVGQGHIMTLATTLAAARPAKNFSIWHTVRQVATSVSEIEADKFDKPANDTLQEIAGIPGPKGIVPASFLLALTVFAILAGGLLRFKRKGEVVWMVLVPVSILLAIGLYIYSRTLTNPQRVTNIGLISSLGDGDVRIQQAFAYCSGPESQEPTFTANSLNGLIKDTGKTATAALEISQVETTASSVILPKQNVRQNATRRFYVDTVMKTAGLEPTFSFNDKGAIGTITNNMGMEIDDAVMMINYKTYRIGTVNADGYTDIQITPDDMLGNIEFKRITERTTTPNRPGPKPPAGKRKTRSGKPATHSKTRLEITGEFTAALTPDQRRNKLIRNILAVPGTFNDINAQPTLIGYANTSIINPLPDRTMPHEGWSVVTWPVKITAPQPGTEVLIPSGFVTKQFDNLKSRVWNPRSLEFHSSVRGSELIIMVRPPWENGKLKDATATIRFDINANGYTVTASGVKLGNSVDERKLDISSRTEIETFSNPAGTFEVTIPQADRFLDKSGWLIFSLDVDKPSTGANPQDAKKNSTTATWQFKSVDVVLKGYAS